jgi:hypothetical protein
MGSLVSRFYIEANSENANSVKKWIGIAPVNHGAAIADFEQLFPDKTLIRNFLVKMFPDMKKDTGAIVNMRTNDPETLSIRENTKGQVAGIEYTVIMGRLGTDPTITPINIASWKDFSKILTKALKSDGQSVVNISEKNYGLTWYGDGVVANKQSELDCATENRPILGQNHNSITYDSTVIEMVKNRIENN